MTLLTILSYQRSTEIPLLVYFLSKSSSSFLVTYPRTVVVHLCASLRKACVS